MTLEITGVVTYIANIYRHSETFSKRSVVLHETVPQYPQTFQVDFVNEYIDLIDFEVNDTIKVTVNVNGSCYTNSKTNEPSAFISLKVWKCENLSKNAKSPIQQHYEQKSPTTQQPTEENDGLPF